VMDAGGAPASSAHARARPLNATGCGGALGVAAPLSSDGDVGGADADADARQPARPGARRPVQTRFPTRAKIVRRAARSPREGA